MGILVVGSVAFDDVKTPFGNEEGILGGSATYFSVAASHFTDVAIVAVVGEDFPQRDISFLQGRNIDVSGLQKVPGRTFRWKGEYSGDMNSAKTLETQLNVFADFSPVLLPQHLRPELLFLGNIDPDLQRRVLEQVERPRVVACDTMNYWVSSKRESLLKTLALVDILLINDGETRQLAEDSNLVRAAKKVLEMGPKTLIVKRGEHGALMVTPEGFFAAPAMPLEGVVDPTGAGDSFAGGFMGYLASVGSVDDRELRRAVAFGTVMASFNVCAFGPHYLASLSRKEIDTRFDQFCRLTEIARLS